MVEFREEDDADIEETPSTTSGEKKTNTDTHAWSNEILNKLFKDKLFVKNDKVRVEVNNFDINCYGDITSKSLSLDGGESGVQYSLRIIIGWAGFYHLGDSCLGEYRGKYNFNDLTNANVAEDKWNIEYKQSDGKSPIDEELKEYMCPAELTIFEDLEANVGVAKEMVREFLRRVCGEEEQPVQDAAALAPEDKSGGIKLPKDLRAQAFPKKYKEFLASGKTGGYGEDTLSLTFCSLIDDDIDDVLGALSASDRVTYLDLSYNSFGDSSIQKLVAALATGTLPGLKTLNLSNNQFGDPGKNVLKGLGFLRKNLTVRLET